MSGNLLSTKAWYSGTDGSGVFIEGYSKNGIRIQYAKGDNYTNYDQLILSNGNIKWNNNSLIHAGNISSQSVNYANSAGSVAWGNVSSKPAASGNSTTPVYWNGSGFTNCTAYGSASVNYANSTNISRYMSCPDTRSTMPAPTTYSATGSGVSFDFKQSSVTGLSGYTGVMTFRPYASSSDWSGGAAHQLGFCGGDNRLYHRTGTSSWSSTWNKIAYTSDIPSTISWSNVSGKPSLITNPMTGSGYIFTVNNSSGGESGIKIQRGGNTAWGLRVNTGNFYLTELTSNTNMLSINETSQGSSATFYGSVYVSSDRHLKKDVHLIDKLSLNDLFDISDKLLKQFTWKDSGKISYGLIAQELELWIPEAVSKDEISGTKTVAYEVAYAKIIAALVSEIKVLKTKVDHLTTRII